MPRSRYTEIKRATYEANMRLPELGLVLYTFGNVSTLDPKAGVFAIKPSGVPYADLKADQMVIVDLDGKVVEGKLKPSSDTRTHQVLYRSFEGLGGVAHTHSLHAVAWAQALREIPVLGTTHADHLTTSVPCTRPMSDEMIKGDYETETGNQIVEHFKEHHLDPHEVQMVLVGCHGPFSWGKGPEEAVYNSRVLEELARQAALTLQINPLAKTLNQALLDKHYQRKHGKNAYYGQAQAAPRRSK
jgi:L-ribulose-5-phosphate 4-epimerase